MNKVKVLLVFALMFLFVLPVNAKEINRFYATADDSINLKETVNGSAALAGNQVTADGQIKGVLFGAGNEVSFSGKTDYAIIAGNSVEVSGLILRDAAIAGMDVEIKDAIFERDVVIGASNLEASGDFKRDAIITSSLVKLENLTVSGNLELYASTIEIGNNVTISGKLSYPEDAKITIADSAVIGKKVKTDSLSQDESLLVIITTKVTSLLCLVVVFVIMSLLLSKLFVKLDNKYSKFNFEKGIEVFTKGLVVLIVVPIISILLMTIVIGVPLALILLAFYVIAIYLAKIFTAYLIGTKITGKWFKKGASILIKGLIGLVILFVLGFIPIISGIVTIVALFIGLGAIYDSIRK